LTGGSGASGASGASGGFFYFILTFPPNSYQAKNYVRLNLCSEGASKLSINGSTLTINGSEAHHKRSFSSEMMAEHPLLFNLLMILSTNVSKSFKCLEYSLA